MYAYNNETPRPGMRLGGLENLRNALAGVGARGRVRERGACRVISRAARVRVESDFSPGRRGYKKLDEGRWVSRGVISRGKCLEGDNKFNILARWTERGF